MRQGGSEKQKQEGGFPKQETVTLCDAHTAWAGTLTTQSSHLPISNPSA